MPQIVRKDDEIAIDIEHLSRRKQFAGKLGLKKLLAGAAGSVQKEDGIGHASVAVAGNLPDRPIVHAQLGQVLARAKVEIAGRVVSLLRDRDATATAGLMTRSRTCQQQRGQ